MVTWTHSQRCDARISVSGDPLSALDQPPSLASPFWCTSHDWTQENAVASDSS
jgi:hypothetical protein